MVNVSLVLLPPWLEELLKKSGKPIEAALDLMQLSRTLSLDDVAFYVAVNTYFYERASEPGITDTFSRLNFFDNFKDLIGHGSSETKPSPEEQKKFLDRLQNRCTNHYSVLFNTPQGETSNRSLLESLPFQAGGDTENSDQKRLFEIFFIRDNIFGLRITKATSDIGFTEQLHKCYGQAIKTLCGFYPFEEVAGTPLFNVYTRLSQRAAQAY